MKIGFSSFTLINQRQDEPQFLTPTRVALQKSEPAKDDPFTKRIKKQQEAFKSLASLPSSKELSQQQASEKVGFLRQRLEMLKATMRFASPERLKSMAKELKSIANQLASAAKLLGSQGGGSVGITATPSVMQPAASAQQAVAPAGSADPAASQASSDGSNQADASIDAQLASAEADIKTAEEDAKRAAEQAVEDNAADFVKDDAVVLLPSLSDITHHNNDSQSTSTGPSASEHALRSVLTEAQKELREVVNELKIRLREEDKEAHRELKKAEEAMKKTDQAIAASTSDALYSSLGQLLPSSDVSVSIMPTINVEV
ncbi:MULTISPECIES: hypothetical protein [unclassified Halomonas]|uniref:hypothetical protein n=1 Tax=unclassified Halomonas TaxID=2609666 RepID=UPI0009906178|nr:MULTISPECIES: hypothetical protein [unclassified Halomonas]AQU81270.1 hypothetical protein B2G49_00750 [Halomonas sp. 'Soap Lake \